MVFNVFLLSATRMGKVLTEHLPLPAYNYVTEFSQNGRAELQCFGLNTSYGEQN